MRCSGGDFGLFSHPVGLRRYDLDQLLLVRETMKARRSKIEIKGTSSMKMKNVEGIVAYGLSNAQVWGDDFK